MAKTYIDVPVIGHRTWLIVTGYKDKDGNFIEDEENDLVRKLRKDYPYSNENQHIIQEVYYGYRWSFRSSTDDY